MACPLIQHPRGWRPRLDARVSARVRARRARGSLRTRNPTPTHLAVGGERVASSYISVPPRGGRTPTQRRPAQCRRRHRRWIEGLGGIRAARGGGKRQRALLPPHTHTRADGGRRRPGGCHHLAGLLLLRHAAAQPRLRTPPWIHRRRPARALRTRLRELGAAQRDNGVGQSYPSTRTLRPRAAPRGGAMGYPSTRTLRPRAVNWHHVGAGAADAWPRRPEAPTATRACSQHAPSR